MIEEVIVKKKTEYHELSKEQVLMGFVASTRR